MLTINEKQEFLKTIIDLIKKYPMELSIERRPKEYSFDIKQVNDTDFIINMTRTSSFKNGKPFTHQILKYIQNEHYTSVFVNYHDLRFT